MPRQPRIEYEDALHDVMARGDRREALCRDEADRAMFARTMGQACEKCGWRMLAWVLMGNHYHWALQTPRANLVAGMGWFQNTFTRRLNTRHRLWGHVFGGRHKAVLVEGEGPDAPAGGRGGYLPALRDYAHLNPARAGLVASSQGSGLLDYRWSSLAQGYGVAADRRPGWMAVAEGLAVFGWQDRAGDRRKYIERLEQRAAEGGAESAAGERGLASTLRRGWYWGGQEFREALLRRVERRAEEGSRDETEKPVERRRRSH